MPPKFVLQNVLDIRHDRVELLEVEFSQLLKLKVSQQSILEAFTTYQKELMIRLMENRTGEVDLFQLKMLHENILTLDHQITSAREKLRKILEAVDDKQLELIKARQNEETLVTLKNKRLETYNEELAQYEARNMDDIYIAQAFRKRSIEGQA